MAGNYVTGFSISWRRLLCHSLERSGFMATSTIGVNPINR